jgi:hypothetical protein
MTPMRKNLMRSRVVSAAILGLLILIAAGAVFASKRRAVAPPGAGPVVVRVNSVPIYKADVETKARVMANNRNLPAVDDDVRALALQHMVKQEILYQAAPRYGITVSDSELTTAIRDIVESIQSPEMDEVSRQEFAGYVRAMGINVDQYPTDPRVLSSYKRTYLVDRMRQWVIDRVPLEQRTNTQALQAAIDAFIEQQHANVVYL